MDAKKKILVVDGDQNFGHILAKSMDPKKYSIYHASTGIRGVQLSMDHSPDLILCNIALNAVDGIDVSRAFKATSSLQHSPVFFFRDKGYNEKNGHSMIREADVMVKPDRTEDFIDYIDSCVQQIGIADKNWSSDFNTLFQLSPFGIFVCEGDSIVKANALLMDMTGRNQQSFGHLKLEDIFERTTWLKIRHWMKNGTKENNAAFNEAVVLKNRAEVEYQMNLKIADFQTGGEGVQFVGFISPSASEKNTIVNYHLASEICNMLKRENVLITEELENKITRIIKLRSVDNNDQLKAFFTKRENEVLRLTMEGYSIKVIADKLSISSRTVEKYRTNLMEKSGARNIVEVIIFSLKNNLIKI